MRFSKWEVYNLVKGCCSTTLVNGKYAPGVYPRKINQEYN